MSKGWHKESARHSLAARGCKTRRKSPHKSAAPKGAKNVMSKEEFEDGYVYARYPGLTGYAYNADFWSEDDGMAIMKRIMRNVDWIEGGINPVLHMKNGKELSALDTNDFPQPTSEDIEGMRAEQEEE